MSVNRRDFLRIGTGGAVAASLALESLPAQVPESSVSTETRRIDFHSHAFPAELLRSLGKYYPEIIHYKEDPVRGPYAIDRKSTRLNSSHGSISYAVFCL